MPSLLSPQQLVLLEEDTQYLEAGIPDWGSAVMVWHAWTGDVTVLIYNSPTVGYVVSDISDLPATTIAAIAQQSSAHGMLYYLPQAIQETIKEDAEWAVGVAKQAGEATIVVLQAAGTAAAAALKAAGEALAGAAAPVVNALMPVLVVAGLVLAFALSRK